MKKTIYLLNIDNYAPEITALTYPHIEKWAKRIGADIVKITERKFPEYPTVYEKLQIYELAKENKSDWNIYIDSDTLVHPDLPDVTQLLSKDTVLQGNHDFSPHRANFDQYILRDGRFIGTANWFTVFSDWCLDLFRPLDDMTLEEAMGRMSLINAERVNGMKTEHLIDDFVLTRNLARYGLKYKTIDELFKEYGREGDVYLKHDYLMSNEKKVETLKEVISEWKI